MPSLIRFLFIVGLIVAIGYGIVFALATFVPLNQREIVVTVPPQNFLKR